MGRVFTQHLGQWSIFCFYAPGPSSRKNCFGRFLCQYFFSGWEVEPCPKPRYCSNTFGNEGAQSLSSDGTILFFTACDREDGYGRCDIYVSFLVRGEWSLAQNIGPSVNSPHWESQPSISPDGKELYFVSNRPGGKGKMDLWKSSLTEEGSFGQPINLGKEINTQEDEMSPLSTWITKPSILHLKGIRVWVISICF